MTFPFQKGGRRCSRPCSAPHAPCAEASGRGCRQPPGPGEPRRAQTRGWRRGPGPSAAWSFSPRPVHPHVRQFPGRGFHVFDAKRCFCRPSGRGIGDVRAGLLEEAEHPGSTNTDLGAARAAGASPTRAPRGSPGTPAGGARRGEVLARPRAPRGGRSPRSPPFVCSDRPGSSTPFQTTPSD